MNKRQKQILYIGGGALALILVYRWYQSRQAAAQSPLVPTTGPDLTGSGQQSPGQGAAIDTLGMPTSADLSGLSAQEQQDVANLQAQLAQTQGQIGAQEQTDIAGLGAQLAQAQGQEQADVGGLTSQLQPSLDAYNQATRGANAASGQAAAAQKRVNRLERQLKQAMRGMRPREVRRLENQIKQLRSQVKKLGPAKAHPHTTPHQPAQSGRGSAGQAVASRKHSPQPVLSVPAYHAPSAPARPRTPTIYVRGGKRVNRPPATKRR